MIANEDAVRAFPQLAKLIRVEQARWAFCSFPDERGVTVGLVGWQSEGNTTDALWIFDLGQCRAARLILGEDSGIDWEFTGDLATCVDELLALPPLEEHTILIRAGDRVSPLWTP